jgi:hypothetical protein
MGRVILLLAASLTLSVPAASGASGDAAATKIVLLGRQGHSGAWRNSLRLKLVRTDIVNFSVCAVWDQPLRAPTCRAAAGKKLPAYTLMRLEQRRPSSARWRRVALSTEPALGAVLSNTVSGNRPGTVLYRVTLRSPTGHIRATSNTFRIVWHK